MASFPSKIYDNDIQSLSINLHKHEYDITTYYGIEAKHEYLLKQCFTFPLTLFPQFYCSCVHILGNIFFFFSTERQTCTDTKKLWFLIFPTSFSSPWQLSRFTRMKLRSVLLLIIQNAAPSFTFPHLSNYFQFIKPGIRLG